MINVLVTGNHSGIEITDHAIQLDCAQLILIHVYIYMGVNAQLIRVPVLTPLNTINKLIRLKEDKTIKGQKRAVLTKLQLQYCART